MISTSTVAIVAASMSAQSAGRAAAKAVVQCQQVVDSFSNVNPTVEAAQG